jgi:hypothetical protein
VPVLDPTGDLLVVEPFGVNTANVIDGHVKAIGEARPAEMALITTEAEQRSSQRSSGRGPELAAIFRRFSLAAGLFVVRISTDE